jgi:hypothetical protein
MSAITTRPISLLALIGIGAGLLCKLSPLRIKLARPALGWVETHAEIAYPLAFICSFEVAELFESLLSGQHFARQVLASLH